ncbi:MAG: hypothetical protein JWN48_712 [Myxococcaceae bacterium]|nr:hypothetical protein [Myxococcaceae bacterium]
MSPLCRAWIRSNWARRAGTLMSASLAWSMVACDSDVAHRQHDDGQVCLSNAALPAGARGLGPQVFAAGAPAFVSVVADTCLSSSCDHDRQATCTATLQGSELVVTSAFEWTSKGGDHACTADCGSLTASCQTPPLPAGHYTVRQGDVSTTFDVPGTLAAPCIGHAPFE